ncbi:MAG TPA: hypothetical protein VH988_33235 [Thermoanaerobaculia bacterium]|jgi:hypothetical protein|nr:hypothetical protein [Thermoanaerobaculia bacterium]
MKINKRALTVLMLAALPTGLLATLPARAANVNLEGVVMSSSEPGCTMVRDHQGNSFILEGSNWYGVMDNDYVRLEGTIVPDSRCGVTSGIQVANVSTIWRDDTRKVIVYERSRDHGSFMDWVRAHREHEWREWEQKHNIPPPPPQP